MNPANCLKRHHRDTESDSESRLIVTGNSYTCLYEEDSDNLPLEKEQNNRRLSRNESEKLRRDKLNMHILELAKLVPLVTNANKKIDKSTILRLSVNYLRIHHDLVKANAQKLQWRPKFLNNGNLGGNLLESLDSFLFVVSQKGTVNYVSENIVDILGHTQVDMLGHPIYNVIHQEDQELISSQFKFQDGEDNDAKEGHPRSLDLRMLNVCSKQQVSRYDVIRVVGRLKVIPRPYYNFSFGVTADVPKTELCLVAVGKLIYHEAVDVKELAWKDPCYTQWITQHTLEGKILYSDQRSSWLTGYFSQESKGLSPYDLMHPQDIQTVVRYHGLLLQKGEIPSLAFRMFTKAGETLYIASTSHMVVDMWTGKAKSIVSLQVIVKPDEGKRKLKEQSERLAALEAATAQLQIQEEAEHSADTTKPQMQHAVQNGIQNGRVIMDSSGGDVDRIAGAMLEIHSCQSLTERNDSISSDSSPTQSHVVNSHDQTKCAEDTVVGTNSSERLDAPFVKFRKVVKNSDINHDHKVTDLEICVNHKDKDTKQTDVVEVSTPGSTKLAELLTSPDRTPELSSHQKIDYEHSSEKDSFVNNNQFQGGRENVFTETTSDSSWTLSSIETSLSSKDDRSPASSCQDEVFIQTPSHFPDANWTEKGSHNEKVSDSAISAHILESIPQESSVHGHIKKLMELEVKRQEHEKALEQLQMEYNDQMRKLSQLNNTTTASSSELSPESTQQLSPHQSPSSTVRLSPAHSTDYSSSTLSSPGASSQPANSSTLYPTPNSMQPANSSTLYPIPNSSHPANSSTLYPTPNSMQPANSSTLYPTPNSMQPANSFTLYPTPNSSQPANSSTLYPTPHSMQPANSSSNQSQQTGSMQPADSSSLSPPTAKQLRQPNSSIVSPPTSSVQPANSSYPLLHNLLSQGVYDSQPVSSKSHTDLVPNHKVSVSLSYRPVDNEDEMSVVSSTSRSDESSHCSSTSRSDESSHCSISTSSNQQEDCVSDDDLLQNILDECFSQNNVNVGLSDLGKIPNSTNHLDGLRMTHVSPSSGDMFTLDMDSFDFNM